MSGGFFLLGTGVFKSPEQFKKAGGAAADEKLATAGLVRELTLGYTHRRTNLLRAFAKRISQSQAAFATPSISDRIVFA
jgi:hypothetical protein